jgi:hypothetical protein
MKRFILTKLFPLLMEASKTGIDARPEALEDAYEKFAGQLFPENMANTDSEMYRRALVYTRAELAGMTKVAGKKCRDLSPQGY